MWLILASGRLVPVYDICVKFIEVTWKFSLKKGTCEEQLFLQLSQLYLPSRPFPFSTSLGESLWRIGPPYVPILISSYFSGSKTL